MTRLGCLRYAARQDENHAGIVRDLSRCGCSVQELKRVGGGCPDLLVGYNGENHLLEVKRPKCKAQQNQVDWAAEWRGRKPRLVTSTEEALRAIGVIA